MSAFEYQLSRSLKRKTLSIVIRRGQVKVMAPVFLSSRTINTFIENKTPWILEKLQSQQLLAEQSAQLQKQFVEGETFLYLGQSFPLHIVLGNKSSLLLLDDMFRVSLSNRVKEENQARHIKNLLQQWYQQQLTDYLIQRIEYYGQLMGVVHSGLTVRSYKRRWGSCSSKGQLSFNFLLMMAPQSIIDYVIVHEMSHLIHMNHSMQFWAQVKRYYPQHKEAKLWLKTEGASLSLE